MKKCPFCGEEIQDEAMKCEYCGKWLSKKSTDQQIFDASQVRPWVRFWARIFDFALATLVIVLIVAIITPLSLDMPEPLLGMVVLFVWIFIEATLLSTWGTTPGKWLLRITLRDSAGRILTNSDALYRSFLVWWRGLGIGIPIVSLITLIVAYRNLSKNGITTWDHDGNLVLSHKRIGTPRVIVTILFFIGFISLMAL